MFQICTDDREHSNALKRANYRAQQSALKYSDTDCLSLRSSEHPTAYQRHRRAHCCPYIGGCTVHIAAQCPYIGGFPPFKEPTMCSRERLFCLCPLPAGKRDSSEEAFCPQKNCQEELWTIVQREAHYPLVNLMIFVIHIWISVLMIPDTKKFSIVLC